MRYVDYSPTLFKAERTLPLQPLMTGASGNLRITPATKAALMTRIEAELALRGSDRGRAWFTDRQDYAPASP